ncbi:MAG: phosphodiester glycosidase family protein, partial [Proteobacteria bacterium]|nr:phosphodiester glycosidase family protein [Pseudomonadota bacterium]
MSRWIPVLVMLFFLSGAGAVHAWQELEPGLWMGEFHAPKPSAAGDAIITVLRIDPSQFTFHILMASEQGETLTLDRWADRYNL